MTNIRISLVFFIMALLLVGCGAAPVKPVADSSSAAAYGNITLPDGVITNVMLYKVGEIYAPPFKSPPRSHTYTNGNFFFENLEPGKYFLVGFMSGQQAFYFNYRGIDEQKFIDEVAIDIKPGAMAYLGSYEVTGIDRHFIKTDTFDIKRSSKPDNKTILSQLKVAVAGTGWDQRIARVLNR